MLYSGYSSIYVSQNFYAMTDKEYYKLFGLEYGFTWEELCEAYQRVHEKAQIAAEKGGALEKFKLRQVDEAYDYLQKEVYVEDDCIFHGPPKHPRKNDARFVNLKN